MTSQACSLNKESIPGPSKQPFELQINSTLSNTETSFSKQGEKQSLQPQVLTCPWRGLGHFPLSTYDQFRVMNSCNIKTNLLPQKRTAVTQYSAEAHAPVLPKE